MGCGVVRLRLLISLACLWGMCRGARETVLGTLGKATRLRIPPDLRNLTQRFGTATWKRDTEDPQRKLVLLKYLDGNYTNYMPERAHFHTVDFSLEILNTSREDRQLHEYIVSKGPEEKVWQIQLEVYEPVSHPSIHVLGWALANGSCAVTLNCTAERGDNVSYSWGSWDTATLGLCSRNGSLLHLSYPLRNASVACACTASNPVSRRVATFNSSQCSYEQGGGAGLRTEHLVLLVVVPVAAVVVLTGGFVAAHLPTAVAVREQQHPPLAEENAVHTIYSQVQRVEKHKAAPATEHPPCTTIYAAATGLPPDTAPAPEAAPQAAPRPPRSPPAEPPAQQGPPSLSQSPDKEPTTVYASVMMPVA